MAKPRLVSGMRTTGSLHLGHLEGTLRNWVRFQDDYECLFFAADWHAHTDRLEIDNLPQITHDMFIDWLSVGLDPAKVTLFRQSHMPQTAELCTLLSMFTPLGWLERCPTFKDEVRDEDTRERCSLGKLMYPVLMTADVALYQAAKIPVGKDQIPHLELSREILRRFNNTHPDMFVEPQPVLSEVPMLLGIDNRKMSKSYNNAIELRDSADALKNKVHNMITDPQRVRRNDPGNPDVCTVFSYHKIYTPARTAEIDPACRAGTIGCRDCKGELLTSLERVLAPIRERRAQFEATPGLIPELLARGEKRATEIADATIDRVRRAMGFTS